MPALISLRILWLVTPRRWAASRAGPGGDGAGRIPEHQHQCRDGVTRLEANVRQRTLMDKAINANSQPQEFLEAARKLGADDDEAAFKEKLGVIAAKRA